VIICVFSDSAMSISSDTATARREVFTLCGGSITSIDCLMILLLSVQIGDGVGREVH